MKKSKKKKQKMKQKKKKHKSHKILLHRVCHVYMYEYVQVHTQNSKGMSAHEHSLTHTHPHTYRHTHVSNNIIYLHALFCSFQPPSLIFASYGALDFLSRSIGKTLSHTHTHAHSLPPSESTQTVTRILIHTTTFCISLITHLRIQVHGNTYKIAWIVWTAQLM